MQEKKFLLIFNNDLEQKQQIVLFLPSQLCDVFLEGHIRTNPNTCPSALWLQVNPALHTFITAFFKEWELLLIEPIKEKKCVRWLFSKEQIHSIYVG